MNHASWIVCQNINRKLKLLCGPQAAAPSIAADVRLSFIPSSPVRSAIARAFSPSSPLRWWGWRGGEGTQGQGRVRHDEGRAGVVCISLMDRARSLLVWPILLKLQLV